MMMAKRFVVGFLLVMGITCNGVRGDERGDEWAQYFTQHDLTAEDLGFGAKNSDLTTEDLEKYGVSFKVRELCKKFVERYISDYREDVKKNNRSDGCFDYAALAKRCNDFCIRKARECGGLSDEELDDFLHFDVFLSKIYNGWYSDPVHQSIVCGLTNPVTHRAIETFEEFEEVLRAAPISFFSSRAEHKKSMQEDSLHQTLFLESLSGDLRDFATSKRIEELCKELMAMVVQLSRNAIEACCQLDGSFNSEKFIKGREQAQSFINQQLSDFVNKYLQSNSLSEEEMDDFFGFVRTFNWLSSVFDQCHPTLTGRFMYQVSRLGALKLNKTLEDFFTEVPSKFFVSQAEGKKRAKEEEEKNEREMEEFFATLSLIPEREGLSIQEKRTRLNALLDEVIAVEESITTDVIDLFVDAAGNFNGWGFAKEVTGLSLSFGNDEQSDKRSIEIKKIKERSQVRGHELLNKGLTKTEVRFLAIFLENGLRSQKIESIKEITFFYRKDFEAAKTKAEAFKVLTDWRKNVEFYKTRLLDKNFPLPINKFPLISQNVQDVCYKFIGLFRPALDKDLHNLKQSCSADGTTFNYAAYKALELKPEEVLLPEEVQNFANTYLSSLSVSEQQMIPVFNIFMMLESMRVKDQCENEFKQAATRDQALAVHKRWTELFYRMPERFFEHWSKISKLYAENGEMMDSTSFMVEEICKEIKSALKDLQDACYNHRGVLVVNHASEEEEAAVNERIKAKLSELVAQSSSEYRDGILSNLGECAALMTKKFSWYKNFCTFKTRQESNQSLQQFFDRIKSELASFHKMVLDGASAVA